MENIWKKNQKSYREGLQGEVWLCKKGSTSRMAYYRDVQPDKRKKEAKEQIKRQSICSKTPQLFVHEGQKKNKGQKAVYIRYMQGGQRG